MTRIQFAENKRHFKRFLFFNFDISKLFRLSGVNIIIHVTVNVRNLVSVEISTAGLDLKGLVPSCLLTYLPVSTFIGECPKLPFLSFDSISFAS
jgi:hypothetical protein